MSGLLAEEFVRLGHSVRVLTQTEGAADSVYPIVRKPSLGQLFEAIRWCDLFWQNNLSLRTLWPILVLRKPVVITHQGSYCRKPTGLDVVQRLKHAVVAATTSVAISQAVADCFETASTVIPNPYDARKFGGGRPFEERSSELMFLGRLVSEKGVDLLLEALGKLRERDLFPRLTIVGDGPERANLESLTTALNLHERVTFSGARQGRALIDLLQEHQILVVPSRYDEPFGVVALEGIAAGCVVVGSAGGGLPEAMGPCGLTFPNGSAAALADLLEGWLRQPNETKHFRTAASAHLARFHPAAIAEAYLLLFQNKLAT